MTLTIDTRWKGLDFGPRKGTLGWAVHMTEGNGGIGDVVYLAQRSSETIAAWRERVNNVSAHFVIINTGAVYQMVGWGRAAGSMNPAMDSDDVGFYRQSVIEKVLGQVEYNPNAYSLAVELAGKRAVGPTEAQIDSLLELVALSREKYPTLRGAYGHADQTDTKGCPGVAPQMMRFWRQVGHGLFLPDGAGGDTGEPDEEIDVGPAFDTTGAAIGQATVTKEGSNIIATEDGEFVPVELGLVRNVFATVVIKDGRYDEQPAYLVQIPGTDSTGLLLAALASYVPNPPPVAAPKDYPVVVDVGGKQVKGSVRLP